MGSHIDDKVHAANSVDNDEPTVMASDRAPPRVHCIGQGAESTSTAQFSSSQVSHSQRGLGVKMVVDLPGCRQPAPGKNPPQ
jgi:hypothetical protein